MSQFKFLLRSAGRAVSFACCLTLLLTSAGCTESSDVSKSSAPLANSQPPLWGEVRNGKPPCVKGIHLTSWFAGSKKTRPRFEKILADTEINTAVIDIKEVTGEIYVPGLKLDPKMNAYKPAIPDLAEYVKYLKDRGIYTIARLTVFKDAKLPKAHPEWAIKSKIPIPKAAEEGYQADVWCDHKGNTWADPYNPHVWDYNIAIAQRAVELGFQEVQFDYIRFPSDGFTDRCIYSQPHTRKGGVSALAGFLKRAATKIHPMGAEISIDVFGLAGSYEDGLGIGQRLAFMLDDIDSVSPMMYPSHYADGEYGIKSPNSSPYETVFISVRDTQKVIGSKKVSLRPWIQDFSLRGVHYSADRVHDQIDAMNDLGVGEYLLWNPACKYTEEALEPFFKRATPRHSPLPEESKPTPTPTPTPSKAAKKAHAAKSKSPVSKGTSKGKKTKS